MITLVPAYNRDYKNKQSVKTDFNENKDFIIKDMFSPYDGKPANKTDLKREGIKQAKIRYNKLQKVIVIDL